MLQVIPAIIGLVVFMAALWNWWRSVPPKVMIVSCDPKLKSYIATLYGRDDVVSARLLNA